MNARDRRSGKTGGAAEALAATGAAYHQNGRLREAEDCYRRVLAIEPKRTGTLYLLGIIALQTGRPELAIDSIGQAVAIDGSNAEWVYHLALAHQMRGSSDEAIRLYARAIELNPRYAEAHTNLGNALAQHGRLDEAIGHYETVLDLKPASPETLYNLANAFAQQRRYPDAISRYRRAVALQPGFAEAHTNLGIALLEQGNAAEAEACHRRALAINSRLVEAHYNLGTVLIALGRPAEAAACCLEAVTIQPKFTAAAKGLVRALLAARDHRGALAAAVAAVQTDDNEETRALAVEALNQALPTPDVPGLRELLTRALAERWCRPVLLAGVAGNLVAQGAAMRDHLLGNVQGMPSADALARDELFIRLLQSAPVTGVAMERFLTAARSSLLARAEANGPAEALSFDAALAEQCFINGYVFDASTAEIDRAEKLKTALATSLSSGGAISPLWPVAVAAYTPLHTLPNPDALLERSWSDPVARVLAQQVRQPAEERRLAATIRALTPIGDGVSSSVRAQYEESPYPVWIATPKPARSVRLEADLRAKFPHAPFPDRADSTTTELLIAGCGTGQQAVELAQQVEGAAVLAVDLSLASLAYARRQTEALGLSNVEYAQADILNLGGMGRTFDAVVSTGVLHHMAEPEAGLRTLASLLRPGGYMLLGFYSEAARREVVAVQRHAAERRLAANAADIRRLRREIFALDDASPLKAVLNAPDFYSISECRDLIFHVQEHRTTLPQIKRMLAEQGLEFLGFEIDAGTRRAYAAQFPDDKAMTDLDRWHEFETQRPKTFVGMYQFWAWKRA